MEYRKIVYFLKVAEKRSFSRAAEELFISPQALSRQIQELENTLGYPLFRRTTVKVELTENGSDVYARFAGLRDAWEKAWAESLKEKRIRFVFFQGLTQIGLLDRLLNMLSDWNKDASLEIFSRDIPQIRQDILQGEVDIAYTSVYEGEQYPGYEKHVLLKDPAFAFLPQTHPLARKTQLCMEDLLHEKILVVKDFHIEKGTIFDQLKKAGNLKYINESFSVIQETQTGKGIGLLPRIYTLENYPGFVYLPLSGDCSFDFESCIVFKKDHPFAPQFRRIAIRLSTKN